MSLPASVPGAPRPPGAGSSRLPRLPLGSGSRALQPSLPRSPGRRGNSGAGRWRAPSSRRRRTRSRCGTTSGEGPAPPRSSRSRSRRGAGRGRRGRRPRSAPGTRRASQETASRRVVAARAQERLRRCKRARLTAATCSSYAPASRPPGPADIGGKKQPPCHAQHERSASIPSRPRSVTVAVCRTSTVRELRTEGIGDPIV